MVEWDSPGRSPPQALDVRIPEAIVHEDAVGGANQTLRALAAADGGGFAVVWQDQRDGQLGLEVRRLASSGEPLEPEHPLHDCTSGRSLDPVVAVAPDGSGSVAWISARSYLAQRVWVRSFDAQGRFVGPARPVEIARAAEKGAPRRGGASRPAIARRRDGGYSIAWSEPSGIRMLEVDANGNWSDRPGTVMAPGSPPRSVELGTGPRGGVLCAFEAGDRWLATVLGKGAPPDLASPGATRSCGAGDLEKLAPDLLDGYWGSFRTPEGSELRHLGANGEPDRPSVRLPTRTEPLASDPSSRAAEATGASSPPGHEHRTDFTVWRGGLAVLETQEGGPLLLHLFDAEGRPLAPEPIRATSAEARPIGDGRIVSNGNLLYIAWTDRRNGDPDVYGRSFDPGSKPGDPGSKPGDPGSRPGEAGARPGEAGSRPGEARERGGDAASGAGGSGSGAGDAGSRAGEAAARAGDPGARAGGSDLRSDRGLGAETRLNSDVASSDQIRPALAAAGARVLVAWQDQRDARSEVFARRRTIPDLLGRADSTDARGSKKTEEPTESKRPEEQKRASDPRSSGASKNAWDEHEFQIPVGRVGPGDPPRSRPAVAMLESGIALVAWIEGAAGEIGIRAQVLPDSGEPPRSDVLVQTLRQEPSRIAVAPLGEREGRRGFLVVFDATGEGEIRSATVGIEGEIASPPAPIGGGAGDLVSDPAVAVLDDGRAIVCWSRRSSDPAALDRAWSIRGRFLAVDGAPTGKEIEFEPSPGGVDWEPAAAPGSDGGFLLAWTAGTRESAVRGREWRDVVARAFDPAANPITPLLRISPDPGEQDHPEIVRLADGSSAVAWEDDISGHDEAHLRRIPKSGRDLGPIVRLDSPSRGCALDHQAPRIAPARSGFAAIWSSSERSKGWDVVLEAFGPRFDSLTPR